MASICLVFKWLGCMVFKWHLKTRPFGIQPLFNHLNTRLVRYSDPHCRIYLSCNWKDVVDYLFWLWLWRGCPWCAYPWWWRWANDLLQCWASRSPCRARSGSPRSSIELVEIPGREWRLWSGHHLPGIALSTDPEHKQRTFKWQMWQRVNLKATSKN